MIGKAIWPCVSSLVEYQDPKLNIKTINNSIDNELEY